MAEPRKAVTVKSSHDAQEQTPTGATTKRTHCHAPKLQDEVELMDGINAKIQWKDGSQSTSSAMYKVSWWRNEADKHTDETESTEYVMKELEPGYKYSVYVIQIDPIEKKNVSPASRTINFNTVPKMPVDIEVENYEGSPHDKLMVSFKDENCYVKDMEFEVVAQSLTLKKDDVEKVTKAHNALIEGLTPGESYSVYARTTDGHNWSKIAFHGPIIKTYPAKPMGVNLDSADDCLTFSWKALDIKPNHYKVFWDENGTKKDSDTTDTSFTLNSLEPSTTYKFRVAAVNKSGQSLLSDVAKVTTAPSAPENIRVLNSTYSPESSFIVKFEDPDPMKKKYEVTAISMDGTIASTSTSENHTAVLNELDAGQQYHIYVVAIYQGLKSERAFYAEQRSE